MMADIHHIHAHRVVHLPIRTLDEISREHEAQPIDLYAALAEQEAPAWRDELRADWREFCAELVASPYSHAFVALLGFIAGLLLVIVPAMIGAGMLS